METENAALNLNGRLSQNSIGRSTKGPNLSEMKACVLSVNLAKS